MRIMSGKGVLDLAAGRRANDEAVCAMLRAEPRLVEGVEVRICCPSFYALLHLIYTNRVIYT
jgi:hypothetical protein